MASRLVVYSIIKQNPAILSKLAPRVAWGLWHFGDRGARIRPYRMFKSRVDMSPRNKTNYSKLEFVMSQLPAPAANAAVGTDGAFVDIAAWEAVDVQIAEVLAQAYPGGAPRRAADVSYVTLYDRLLRLRPQPAAQAGRRQRRRLQGGAAAAAAAAGNGLHSGGETSGEEEAY